MPNNATSHRTAYVTIPVDTVQNVVKVPNTALRYKPPLAPEQILESRDRKRMAGCISVDVESGAGPDNASGGVNLAGPKEIPGIESSGIRFSSGVIKRLGLAKLCKALHQHQPGVEVAPNVATLSRVLSVS